MLQIELGPGDGTVNKRSLEACAQLGPRVSVMRRSNPYLGLNCCVMLLLLLGCFALSTRLCTEDDSAGQQRHQEVLPTPTLAWQLLTFLSPCWQVEMHTFRNVSHKGILSDADAVARVLDIIHRYGRFGDDDSSNSSSMLRQTARGELRGRAGHRRKGVFSFLQFAGEPFRRWNFMAPRAESS